MRTRPTQTSHEPPVELVDYDGVSYWVRPKAIELLVRAEAAGIRFRLVGPDEIRMGPKSAVTPEWVQALKRLNRQDVLNILHVVEDLDSKGQSPARQRSRAIL